MHQIAHKEIRVALDKINLNLDLNVRDNDVSVVEIEYNLPPLIEDIATNGQDAPLLLEKLEDGTYNPIRGFRRTAALKKLAEEKRIDPFTKKPFDSARAFVVTNISAAERAELLVDHGQRKGLGKVGLFRAYEALLEAGLSNEREMVIKLFTLLEINYPPKRVIKPVSEDKGKDALENWRGVLQTMKAGHEAPNVLRELYVKRLRGQQAWPTNAELNTLMKIHNAEVAENPTLTRSAPGPKFTAKFNEMVAEHAKAEAEGTRPKSISQRTRQQNEDALKVVESYSMKCTLHAQLGNLPAEAIPKLDKLFIAMEGKCPEEAEQLKAILLSTVKNETK